MGVISKSLAGVLWIFINCVFASITNSQYWRNGVCDPNDAFHPNAAVNVIGFRPGTTEGTIQVHWEKHFPIHNGTGGRTLALVFVPELDQKLVLASSKSVSVVGNGFTHIEDLAGQSLDGWSADIAIPADKNYYVYSSYYNCDYAYEVSQGWIFWALNSKKDDENRRTFAPLMVSRKESKDFEYSAVELNNMFGFSGIAIRIKLIGNPDHVLVLPKWLKQNGVEAEFILSSTTSEKGIYSVLNRISESRSSGAFQSSDIGQQDAIIWIPKSELGDNAAGSVLKLGYSIGFDAATIDLPVQSELPVFQNIRDYVQTSVKAPSLTNAEKLKLALGLWLRGDFSDGGFRLRERWDSEADDFEEVVEKVFNYSGYFKQIATDPNVVDYDCSAFSDGFAKISIRNYYGVPKYLHEAEAYSSTYALNWSTNVNVFTLDPVSKKFEPIDPCLAEECYLNEKYQAKLTGSQWLSVFKNGIWIRKSLSEGDEDSDQEDSQRSKFSVNIEPIEPFGNAKPAATPLYHGKDLQGLLDDRIPFIRPFVGLNISHVTADDPQFRKDAYTWVGGAGSVLPVANPNVFRFVTSPQTTGQIRADSYVEEGLQSVEEGGLDVQRSKLIGKAFNPRDLDIYLPREQNAVKKDARGATLAKRAALVVSQEGTEKYILPWQYFPSDRIYYIFHGGRSDEERGLAKGAAQLNAAMIEFDLHAYIELAAISMLPITGGQDNALDWVERAFRWSTGKPYLRNFYGINGEYADGEPLLGEALKNDTVAFITPLQEKKTNLNLIGTTWIGRQVSNTNDITYSIRPNSNRFYSSGGDEVLDLMYRTHYQQSNGYLLAHQTRRTAGLRYALPKWAVVSSEIIQDVGLAGEFIRGARVARAAELSRLADDATESSVKALEKISKKVDLGAIKAANQLIDASVERSVQQNLARVRLAEHFKPGGFEKPIRGMVLTTHIEAKKPWQAFEASCNYLYGSATPKMRKFQALVNGKLLNGESDGVARIGNELIGVEAKHVSYGWKNSLMNPFKKWSGRGKNPREKYLDMLAQAEKYQNGPYDRVIYHSNDLELCKFYQKEFAVRGYDKIEWVWLR